MAHNETDDLQPVVNVKGLLWIGTFVLGAFVIALIIWVASGGFEAMSRPSEFDKIRRQQLGTPTRPQGAEAGLPPMPFEGPDLSAEPGDERSPTTARTPQPGVSSSGPVNPPALEETSPVIKQYAPLNGTDSYRPEAYPGQNSGRPSYMPPTDSR
ncbi:MAG: hypothetical protein KIT11_11720 [Fimbriimonadaceae bacterium]|nr:hypothetical protein [Fimbriimonadaceae bacterium]QYK55298.1 MAG: hypothetical protein KF733_09815 [Fimbriimonadaceae bacterium]